jgi:hypothetical protein
MIQDRSFSFWARTTAMAAGDSNMPTCPENRRQTPALFFAAFARSLR